MTVPVVCAVWPALSRRPKTDTVLRRRPERSRVRRRAVRVADVVAVPAKLRAPSSGRVGRVAVRLQLQRSPLPSAGGPAPAAAASRFRPPRAEDTRRRRLPVRRRFGSGSDSSSALELVVDRFPLRPLGPLGPLRDDTVDRPGRRYGERSADGTPGRFIPAVVDRTLARRTGRRRRRVGPARLAGRRRARPKRRGPFGLAERKHKYPILEAAVLRAIERDRYRRVGRRRVWRDRDGVRRRRIDRQTRSSEGSEHGTADGVGHDRSASVCVPTAHGPGGNGVA